MGLDVIKIRDLTAMVKFPLGNSRENEEKTKRVAGKWPVKCQSTTRLDGPK